MLLKADELLTREPQVPDLGWGELAAGGVEVHGILFKRDSSSDPEEKPHQAVAFSGLEEL
ncbi:MAG: hypothetical protein GY835_02715 [bacterium]|nr:hypothetical protein [bacterium]